MGQNLAAGAFTMLLVEDWKCFVGFLGTLLVIQPNFVDVGYAALLPLGVAVVFALFMMATRKVARAMDPIQLQTVSGLQAIVVLGVALIIFPGLRGETGLDLGTQTWLLIVGMGVLGTFAHLFMTWSLRFAPASTLAPMQYLEIPFSTLIGWLIFREFPNGLAAIGICITMAAGLYVIIREQRLSKQPPVVPGAA